MNRFFLVPLLCSALFSFGSFSAAEPQASLWQQLAKTDLDYVYQQIKANHPGVLDTENPAFISWLEQGYKEGQQALSSVQNLNDLMNIHRRYFAGFADGHLYLQLGYQRNFVQWPGVIVQLRQGKTTVSSASQSWSEPLPAVGAELVSCDGLTADQWLDQRILPNRFNLPVLKAARLLYTPFLLKDEGVGNYPKAQQCIFAEQGQLREYKLVWRGTDESQWRAALSPYVTTEQFSFNAFGKQNYWLTIPGFSPNQTEQQQLKAVIKQLSELQSAEWVVFDMRGNRGGNSQWGRDLATALYGEAYVKNELKRFPDQSMAYWRASAENTADIRGFLPDLAQQFGKDSAVFAEFSQLTERMTKADAQHLVPQRLTKPNEHNKNPTVQWKAIQPRVHTKVIFLTDIRCGSACLDFADIMLRLPGVIHAGQPTWADTLYMDIRTVQLPSKLGYFSIPQKLYRNRPRSNNQPYEPEAEWTFSGDIQADAELKKWLSEKIQNNI
ncbi:periplasmic protease [Rheinheimera sp. A13L]|uniref:S41 family peptidase n=1 Tax=Rheinheimera sp. A13L TaxID=506534 RepID=UPI00021254FA|nr:S41 family peptidase [Rheinheimera sp. A13L]EGM77259.1 periplasmic protease [Rheinheimera sp. A13L]